jgi:hypothetical protein
VGNVSFASGLFGEMCVTCGSNDADGKFNGDVSGDSEGPESLRLSRSTLEVMGDARELGGPRLASEAIEIPEVLRLELYLDASCESQEAELDLLLDTELLGDLTEFGMPSHLELTLGTVAGSFCRDIPWRPTGVAPLVAICLRCDSAYCSRASWDGSFMARKLSTPFFFFLDDFALFDVVPLEEARLVDADQDDVILLESEEGQPLVVVVVVVVVVVEIEAHGWSSRVSLMLGSFNELGEEDEVSSGGRRFRYVSLGIRHAGARAATSGAAIC